MHGRLVSFEKRNSIFLPYSGYHVLKVGHDYFLQREVSQDYYDIIPCLFRFYFVNLFHSIASNLVLYPVFGELPAIVEICDRLSLGFCAFAKLFRASPIRISLGTKIKLHYLLKKGCSGSFFEINTLGAEKRLPQVFF